MAKEIREGKFTYWLDGSGMKVPLSRISEEEKLQDEIITKHIKRAKELKKLLREFKEEVRQDSKVLLDLVAEKYDEESWQGNATVYDFSKQIGIMIKNQKRKDFGAAVNVAVSKIDKWISLAADRGENMDLINMVRKFTKVDDGGKYDKNNLKQLLDLTIVKEAELWEEAMSIIRESEEVILTKLYFQFLERSKEEENDFNKILLSFAHC